MENKLQKYKDIWYMYIPSIDVWAITDGPNWSIATVSYYSNQYRIDQAIEQFINEYII